MGRKFRVEKQEKRKKPGLYYLNECSSLLTLICFENRVGAFFQSELSPVVLPLVLSISFLPGCEVTQSRLWISKKAFSTFFLFMHKTSIAYLISTAIRVT